MSSLFALFASSAFDESKCKVLNHLGGSLMAGLDFNIYSDIY